MAKKNKIKEIIILLSKSITSVKLNGRKSVKNHEFYGDVNWKIH